MSKRVTETTDKDFDQDVLQSTTPVLVDFWAPWCGPCKSIAPVLDQLADEYDGKLKIVKVNVDHHKEAAMKYNVRGIPKLIIFKGGEVKQEITGAVPRPEIEDAIKKVV
jgi:thioredoxin 1